MWWSKLPSLSALALAGMALSAPLAAQQRAPTTGMPDTPEARPRSETECRAFAIQRSNEEYLAQDSSVRRNAPFQSGPPGIRDPFTDSQRQDLNIDRAGREQQLYDACVEWLRQQR
ncbi:MAG: hypothetical protein AB7R90_09640 [Reyranellaceae bacterium]